MPNPISRHVGSLPASFRSLYRILLRATSASVLHHTGATRNTRRLYRPIFDEAASVHIAPVSSIPSEAKEAWLAEFDKRMDTTLAFLYTSAVQKGAAHKITQTNALLLQSFLIQQQRSHTSTHKVTWDPQKPGEAAHLAEKQLAKRRKEGDRKAMIERAVSSEWALRETRSMAEGRGGLILGREPLSLTARRRSRLGNGNQAAS